MPGAPTSPDAVPGRVGATSAHGALTGSLLVMTAGLLRSFGGLAVRLAGEADGWHYMIYRAGGQVIATALFSLAQRRGSVLHRFVRAGPAVWLAAALGLAGYSTCLRGGGERDWEAAVFGFGFMALPAAVAGTVVLGQSPLTAPVGMAVGFTHGSLFNGVGSTLYVYGARHVPAAQMTILVQTETICGPLWVWLLLGEVTLPATLQGGALILLAIGLRATAGFTARPQPRIAD